MVTRSDPVRLCRGRVRYWIIITPLATPPSQIRLGSPRNLRNVTSKSVDAETIQISDRQIRNNQYSYFKPNIEGYILIVPKILIIEHTRPPARTTAVGEDGEVGHGAHECRVTRVARGLLAVRDRCDSVAGERIVGGVKAEGWMGGGEGQDRWLRCNRVSLKARRRVQGEPTALRISFLV